MDIKESVQNQFGLSANNYATSAVHVGGPDLTAMVAAANLQGGERVLDVGCGTGHTALAFAQHAAEVVAVDLTLAMLTAARRLATERGVTNVRFERGDVEKLSFPDASFDIITSRYSAHHYPHPQVALREMVRMVKPDGMILLVDVVSPNDPTQDTFLNTIELLRDPSHVRDHSIRQWLSMFEEVGLKPEVLGTWPLHLEFESWVARMNTPFLAITQIRTLINGAPREVREGLAIQGEDDYSFDVPVALIRGRRA